MKVLARVVRQEKEIKLIQIGKEKVKSSLLAYNMTLHIETLKTAHRQKKKQKTKKTKTLLELINEFCKIAGPNQHTSQWHVYN